MQLEKDNERLLRAVADRALDKQILAEMAGASELGMLPLRRASR
jgi:hypothetical protein